MQKVKVDAQAPGHADEDAFCAVYRGFSPAVLSYLRARDVEDPEGTTQEVFLALYPQLGDVRGGTRGIKNLPVEADVVRLDDWSRRHPRKKRVVFTTLAVAASLGVAGGAAAGNETLRSQAEGTISSIVRSFSPPAPETPEPTTTTAPASPPSASLSPEAPRPLPAVVYSPAGTPPAPAVPATPAPAQNRAVEPSIRERHGVGTRRNETQAPQNHGTGTPATVPLSKGQPANPGASRSADVPSWAGKPAAGRTNVPADGKAKGKTDAGGGTGQGAGQPITAPTPGNQR